MQSVTWAEVCNRRIARHHLVEPAPDTALVEVVRAVCGIQAQIIAAAELAIGVRIAGVTQQGVRAELWERRGLIKTYGPRETLHLLPADELPLWMAAMRGRSRLLGARPDVAAGMEPARAETLRAAFRDALDGRCLTREELADAVASRAGAGVREQLASTWGELLRPAAFAGCLCFGPSRGSKVTFVRPDQWVGTWREHDPGAALMAVCRRYFAAYGPATHQDFARWFALKPDEAQGLMASLGDDLEEVEVDGRRAWALATERKASRASGRGSLRLLPQYDCYVLGCGLRDRVVPDAARRRILGYGRGRYEGAVGVPVLLVDGVVAGMWERRRRGGRIEIRVESFDRLTAIQRQQLAAEAARIGQFLGAEATVSLGALT